MSEMDRIGMLTSVSMPIHADSRTVVVEADRRRSRKGVGLPIHSPDATTIAIMRGIASARRSIDAGTQCSDTLNVLRQAPQGVTVRDLEDHLCLGHAPRRVADLRESGHTIASEQVLQADSMGRLRRTVRYVLMIERGRAGN